MTLLSYPELLVEIDRVKKLLKTNKKQFTIRQNRKYLAKLLKDKKYFDDHFHPKKEVSNENR